MKKKLAASHTAGEPVSFTPDCVYSAHLRLLAAILKTADGDWRQLQNIEEPFCDRSHAAVCQDKYFKNGASELEVFFDSEWFERICLELNLSPDTVYLTIRGETLGGD